MKSRLLFFLLLLLCQSQANRLEASRPDLERSLDKCQSLLKGFGSRSSEYFSASSLIPLSQLLGSKYCQQIIKNHIEGEVHNKTYPTQGLAQMFLTAKTAADDLIDNLKIEAVRPNYQQRDILQGAEETLRMMLEDKPEFIREGVLVRDGVVMVVPLLYRIRKGNKNTSPLYMPVIVKGHQELEQFDVLSAAFAAWALGEYLGEIPEQAWVHLKPMVKVRKSSAKKLEPDEMYIVNVRDQLPSVYLIHQQFIETLADQKKLAEIEPRRCTQCNVCPWATHCRALMNQNNDLSMMPYPPKKEMAERLGEIGLGSMDALSKLDVNSANFIEAAVHAGIRPDRLRYWVAHAMAKISNRPILIEEYEFPFKDTRYIAHVDFEDALVRNIASGVYLFGTEIEGREKSLQKDFIFADTLDQEGVDEAWATFIRLFKKNRYLKGGNFKLSIYSPHELVKFQQEFDMLTDDPEKFSASERRSIYYSEFEKKMRTLDPDQDEDSDESPKVKRKGRLIRNKNFFRRYKDIRPVDVFALMDRSVDLLDFTRWNFAFPTHSNGLKVILPYVSAGSSELIQYPEGWNGLESVAWAKSAYQTGEKSILEMIRSYNEIDIHGNFVVTRFLRQNADKVVPKKIRYSDATLNLLQSIEGAAQTRALLDRVEAKDQLLENILGRAVANLTSDELSDLALILDRGEYLKARKIIDESKKLSKKAIEQELQMLEHNNENTRKFQLMEFFKKARLYQKEDLSEETMDEIAKLFLLHPTNYVLPNHLYQMLALSHMKAVAKRTILIYAKDPVRRLEIPQIWENIFEDVMKDLEREHAEVFGDRDRDIKAAFNRNSLKKLWEGLYYERAFDGSRIAQK